MQQEYKVVTEGNTFNSAVEKFIQVTQTQPCSLVINNDKTHKEFLMALSELELNEEYNNISIEHSITYLNIKEVDCATLNPYLIVYGADIKEVVAKGYREHIKEIHVYSKEEM